MKDLNYIVETFKGLGFEVETEGRNGNFRVFGKMSGLSIFFTHREHIRDPSEVDECFRVTCDTVNGNYVRKLCILEHIVCDMIEQNEVIDNETLRHTFSNEAFDKIIESYKKAKEMLDEIY